MNSKVIIPAALAILALSACSSSKAPEGGQPQTQQQGQQAQQGGESTAAIGNIQVAQVDGIDRTVEARYTCQAAGGQQQQVNAMYGIKDNTLVVAQLKINNQVSPGLWRVLNDSNGQQQNSYYGNGVIWVTGKATPANVTRVNAVALLQAQSVDNAGNPVNLTSVLQNCTVSRQAAAPARGSRNARPQQRRR
ncbi:hypothetical protein A7P95_07185 [Eikenella longinqua]|uniref:Uncharacterized protein n=1 Tax=Eikenella longinqua TaxID=1795827 RepID=A0A1A9RXX0_9NEIS|nr:hypothetical protein [Eikenella longinqua]OAM27165.1 hypothetical protein A7P95_07185 [Eikenella longinqua]